MVPGPRRRSCHYAIGEMGVVGASVPGVDGEGTSIGGCDGGLSAGASLGWAGSGVLGGLLSGC